MSNPFMNNAPQGTTHDSRAQPAPAPSFGQPAPAPAPAPSFGQPAPAAAPSFGQPAPAAAPSFGQPAPAPAPAPSFGQPAPAAGPNPFAVIDQVAASPSIAKDYIQAGRHVLIVRGAKSILTGNQAFVFYGVVAGSKRKEDGPGPGDTWSWHRAFFHPKARYAGAVEIKTAAGVICRGLDAHRDRAASLGGSGRIDAEINQDVIAAIATDWREPKVVLCEVELPKSEAQPFRRVHFFPVDQSGELARHVLAGGKLTEADVDNAFAAR